MTWPRAEGDFESWSSLAPTLTPLLERQVGRLFMPWTVANAGAIASNRDEFSVELGGRTWSQKAAEVPRAIAGGAAGEV